MREDARQALLASVTRAGVAQSAERLLPKPLSLSAVASFLDT